MKKLISYTMALVFAILSLQIVCAEESDAVDYTVIPEQIRESVVLKIGSSNAMVNGVSLKVDAQNDEVMPQIIDSRTLVPARFISESFGGVVGWENETRTVSIELNEKKIIMVLDSNELMIDGELAAEMDVPAQSIEGRTMIPLRVLCETALEKKVFWDNKGLIIISDSEIVLDSEADAQVIDVIIDAVENGVDMPQKEEVKKEPKDLYEVMQARTSRNFMPYRLYVPESYNPEDTETKYSLVVWFHGHGNGGTDNTKQISTDMSLVDKIINHEVYGEQCIVVAPQCPADRKWTDVPSWEHVDYKVSNLKVHYPMNNALAILDEVKKEFPVDENRMYVTGFSMGGFATWYALETTDIFAAGIPIAGGVDSTRAKFCVDTPIWTFHSADDNIVPVDGTRKMVEEIQKLGGEKIIYTEYENYRHGPLGAAANTEGLLDWLFSQSKEVVSEEITKE